MTTYYEQLKLQPAATAVEIQTALDDRYGKWRRLVIHHDPNVVAQANQALNVLEEIRGTLLVAEKRAMYDSIIGIGGSVMGGLADPDSILQGNPFQEPTPAEGARSGGHKAKVAEERADGWVCRNPSCRHVNKVGTKFCAKCGKKVGGKCPSCSELTEYANPFCPACGVNKEEYFYTERNQKLKEKQREIAHKEGQIQQTQELAQKVLIIRNKPLEILNVNLMEPSCGLHLITWIYAIGMSFIIFREGYSVAMSNYPRIFLPIIMTPVLWIFLLVVGSKIIDHLMRIKPSLRKHKELLAEEKAKLEVELEAMKSTVYD